MSAVLQCERVTRHLQEGPIDVRLVEDISLSINSGEFVAITGASGSGKSSLLYLLGLLDEPTSGTLRLNGQDTTSLGSNEKARLRLEHIGFVFQFHFLLQEFSALENILMPMRKRRKWDETEIKKRAMEILEELGMTPHAHKLPGQMSGGERQRVAIARALANDPLIILADEPTGNLDSKNADIVFKMFERIVGELGKSIITVTHDQDLAARCFRQIHMKDGRLVDA